MRVDGLLHNDKADEWAVLELYGENKKQGEIKMIMAVIAGTLVLFIFVAVICSLATISQGQVGIVERWGRYVGLVRPGLNFIVPFIDSVVANLSIQQITKQVTFEVITEDQANVKFAITILLEPVDDSESTLKLMAYKFREDEMFNTAVEGAVEASIRSIVASKKQSDIIGLRSELVTSIKKDLDSQLNGWGWHLRDMQINNIQFDQTITDSMARVVAAKNSLSAAEFEGQALLVQRTKEAEARGRAIIITAESEAAAERQRGIGLAQFRDELAKGIAESAEIMQKAGVNQEIMTFAMWTETLKELADVGKGNTFFFDGSVDSMTRTMRELVSLQKAPK